MPLGFKALMKTESTLTRAARDYRAALARRDHEIRAARARGLSLRDIARQTGLTPAGVAYVCRQGPGEAS